MIKANELRVGNWVYNHKFGFEIVVAIGLKGYIWFDENRNLSDHLCNPIPLTIEILEKVGFGRTDGEYGNTPYTKMRRGLDYEFTFWAGNVCFIFLGVEVPRVNYLHQLQNLIYSLTGEELGISFSNTIELS